MTANRVLERAGHRGPWHGHQLQSYPLAGGVGDNRPPPNPLPKREG